MVMGVMDIEDIKLFLTEVVGEVRKIPEIIPQGRGLREFQDMVQTELIRSLYPCRQDPLLQTVLHGKRRFSVGQGHLVSPSLPTPYKD